MKRMFVLSAGLAVLATSATAGGCPVDHALTAPSEVGNAPYVGGDHLAAVCVKADKVVEHAVPGAMPLLHRAGDSIFELGAGYNGMWKNLTAQPVIHATDVVPVGTMNDPEVHLL